MYWVWLIRLNWVITFGNDIFQDDRGGTLRVIDVELIDDLVDTCMPGADVVVTGIIKVGFFISENYS